MASLKSYQAIHRYLDKLMEIHLETDDDRLVHDAFRHNDIRHACQAIRETRSGEIEFQHLTLRFGGGGEQSVYQFALSEKIAYCLDLYSLYLALRQTRFQMETFHPDFISNVVVPLKLAALIWQPGKEFFEQVLQCHKREFSHVIPSLQLNESSSFTPAGQYLIEQVRQFALALWFEAIAPCSYLDQIQPLKPDVLKLAITLEDKESRMAFLPIVRFLRKNHIQWVASRVACQKELSQYKLLGANYYFGYFSDIPTPLSFKSFGSENDCWQ